MSCPLRLSSAPSRYSPSRPKRGGFPGPRQGHKTRHLQRMAVRGCGGGVGEAEADLCGLGLACRWNGVVGLSNGDVAVPRGTTSPALHPVGPCFVALPRRAR